MPSLKPRTSEWILAAYFAYTSILALLLSLQPGMTARILSVNTALVLLYALVLRARILRDWMPLTLVLLAYKEMGWFAPSWHDYRLEKSWVVLDRLVLGDWRLRNLIESLGPVIPSVLELCYLLVYALPVVIMAMLYIFGLRDRAGVFLTYYLLGLFLSYVQFPFWPSEPPRTVFPGENAPLIDTFLRRANLFLVGTQGIHTSVFPSAHVSGALAAAFGVRRAVPEKPWFWRGVLIYALLVAVATVYGRYHYLVDAIAGLGVGAFVGQIGNLREAAGRAILSRTETVRTPGP
ncbi:MAG TPA: phosphatase PAP2 family protein [Bryobacteraceae bacterium]|nr:phosphatase PAP2 family protein [Bryobacteraceae bacterium]